MRQLFILIVLGVAFGSHCVLAQEYHSGDMVVVIHNADLSGESEHVETLWPGLTLKVQKVNGDDLWLTYSSSGWLHKSHVIPLNRKAADQLTSLIQNKRNTARLYIGHQPCG